MLSNAKNKQTKRTQILGLQPHAMKSLKILKMHTFLKSTQRIKKLLKYIRMATFMLKSNKIFKIIKIQRNVDKSLKIKQSANTSLKSLEILQNL